MAKMVKDGMYSLRLNKQLVNKVKAEHGLSPQQIIDRAYDQFHDLWDESEEPKRASRGRPSGAKNRKRQDIDLEDL